ncbi:MAG TPA: hypothetical protein VK971_11910 [Thiohalobacter sp.]|nr:hypothetical protein [Thiohalobacter sp.]
MTLTQIHDAILQAMTAQFSGEVENIGHYRPAQTDPVNTPALLLEMEEAQDQASPGNARIPLRCRFTLHCLLSFQTPDVEVQVREFAAAVFRLVRNNTWGFSPQEIKVPEGLELGPGQILPEKDGYEGWFVTWEQVIFYNA